MVIKSIEFLTSVADWRKCPEARFPEYAFIGRSNVGKSSLINMLAQQKGIAKTSGKPGKTQTINHFLVNRNWCLVDLPGYGFAHISKSMRARWVTMIDDYILRRPQLVSVFVLIDIRLEPQANDLEFINRLGELQVPFAIIFTKADKISATKATAHVERYQQKLLETWSEFPPYFITSAENRTGREALLDYIEALNLEVFKTL